MLCACVHGHPEHLVPALRERAWGFREPPGERVGLHPHLSQPLDSSLSKTSEENELSLEVLSMALIPLKQPGSDPGSRRKQRCMW